MKSPARARALPRSVRLAATVGVLVSALMLGACAAEPAQAGPPPATPSTTASIEPSPTPTPEAPPMAVQPLRGTQVPAETITGPALAAKIDNHVAARPQVGLDRTDIVFEELVEGGLTRYVALWFSDVPAEIGPVRSIRPMDPDIVSPFGGLIAYSGGQQRFVDMMLNAPVHNAIHGGADDRFMYRTPSKAAPHNVLVKAQELRAAYADVPPPAQQFAYSQRPQTASAAAYGSAANGFDLFFSAKEGRSWRWDAGSGRYLRSQNGAPDLDSGGGQLAATNVVALSVSIDWAYGDIPKTVMVGSGPAWVATGGKVIQVTWTKASADAPIQLTNQYGTPVYLAPGNTWVELVPDARGGSIAVV
ncbi:DUF3048 domain-containing protein [Microbacterium sp.]|jgi:hypothetical protein|uniref:DUF3048 domain-containing protein n=1 Tax=Microbacterium sp. TaxID=51671 RepID=UPI0037C68F38